MMLRRQSQGVLGAGRVVTSKLKSSQILLGAHVSIAGGVHKSTSRAVELKCTAMQIFTKNATQWAAKPLDPEIARDFKELRKAAGIEAIAHASYLINLATPDEKMRERSIDAFVDEIQRAAELDIAYLALHPGSHKGAGEEAGLQLAIEGLNEAIRRTEGAHVRVLVENTAGQGASIGHRIEHLRRILEGVSDPERVGICFDTCHAFAAGYELDTDSGYRSVMDELDREVGLDRVLALHLNDAKKGRGQRVDRHEHIGKGAMGLTPFRSIMRDRRFSATPKIIETPKSLDGRDMDPVNLALLRKLARKPSDKSSTR